MKAPVASHTFLDTYTRCPKAAFHRFIAKDLPYTETESMKWGNAVHKAMELAINEATPMPEGMAHFGKFITALGDNCKAEVSLGIDIEGNPVKFWAGDVFYRGKVDVIKVHGDAAVIVDWKTGKPREDRNELERHAVLVRAHYPQISKVSGLYVWLKEDRPGKLYDVSRTAPILTNIKAIMRTVEQTIAAGAEFPAVDNPLCGWCAIKPCRYNPN